MNATKKTLKCTVVDASNLAGDKVNPYCEVVVLDTKGNQMGKPKHTKVVKGKAPKWNELVEFSVNSSSFSGLIIRVWDKHTFRRDGFLGQITVKFNTEILEGHEAIDDNFTLSKRGDKKSETVSGQIHLKIQYGELVKREKPKVEKPKLGESGEKEKGDRKALTASKKWQDNDVKLKNSAYVVVEEDDDLPDHDTEGGEDEYDGTRKGPAVAAMEKLNKDQKIALTNKNLEVQNNGSNYGFQYAKGNVKVNGGKWYFEAQLISGQMQVGWCTDNYDPATNMGDSWSYDITGGQIYRKGGNPQSFGEYCYTSDWIGVSLDVTGKSISFYRNGRNMGEPWKEKDVELPGLRDRFAPFVALSKGSKAKFNFGKDAFAYTQERNGFYALNSKLSENELKELNKLFSKYKGLGLESLESSVEDIGDVIQGNGSLKLQEDLGATEEDDPLMMIIAWKLNCTVAWEFSRAEFVEGFALFGCSTLKQIKDKCEEWRREVKNEESFKAFYNFVFGYLKADEKSKVLPLEEAELVWEMLLKPRGWGLYDKWIKFLKRGKHKAASKDVWHQLLEFMNTYPKDLSNYDEMAAWPLMFDEFVEWIKDGEPDEDKEKNDEY